MPTDAFPVDLKGLLADSGSKMSERELSVSIDYTKMEDATGQQGLDGAKAG